jgi:endonuclease/exonuclease/phosphatase family metal-dependent hydrolase
MKYILLLILFMNFLPINATDQKPLRVLSWNIYLLPVLSLFNDNQSRAKAIADQIVESNYDVVVFQEAFSATNRRHIARKIQEIFPYQYGPVNQGRSLHRTNSGLWVVSRIPLTTLGTIRFAEATGFDAVARKGAVLFEGVFNGRKFQLITTHLQADGKEGIRERQLDAIKRDLLEQFHETNVPQLICGDFNIEKSDSETYEGMLRLLNATDGDLSSGLMYSFDESGNTLLRKPEGRKKLIDYFLLRNGEFIHRIERKIRAFQRMVGEELHHLSDHHALEAEIHL